MKFYRKICLFLSVVLLIQSFVVFVTAEDEITDMSVLSGCQGIDAQVPVLGSAQLSENIQSAVLYEVTTGTLMYAWNPDQQLHPAGLVKILTALVALENGNMTDAVTVQQSVLDLISEDARTSGLLADEVFTMEQLLHFLLVEGSNDAALVIAHHIAGSEAAFVEKMNARAAELGCTNSVFTNVHGLHNDQQLTTARDVARILSVAIQNEQFATLFGIAEYKMPATNKSEERELESSHHMMHQNLYEIYFDLRVTGGRTGVNNMGLRSIATTAQVGKMQMVSIVMGCASEVNDRGIVEKLGGFEETALLLDQGFTGYTTAQLLYDGQALKQYSVRNGISDVVVGPNVFISSVIPADGSTGTLSYQYKDIEGAFDAPIEKGRHMSTVEIWCGSVCLAQAELYALNDVDVVYQQVEVKEGGKLTVGGVILILFLVAVVGGGGYLLFMRYRNMRLVAIRRGGRNGRKRRK